MMLPEEIDALAPVLAQLVRTERVIGLLSDQIEKLDREVGRLRLVTVALKERVASAEGELVTIGIRLTGAHEKEEDDELEEG